MNVIVMTLYPLDARQVFNVHAKNWVNSYIKFKPIELHRVIVCMSNGKASTEDMALFNPVTAEFTHYQENGWDIGAYQHVANSYDADLMVFTNSRVRFWKHGWLTRFIEAYTTFGPKGLYGASASNETNPHIRTACFATDPKVLRRFPYTVASREDGFRFESGAWNIMEWYRDHGYPVKMVTWDGFYDQRDWRRPANIFRRGDQSNCLVWDKHHDIYFQANPQEKIALANRTG